MVFDNSHVIPIIWILRPNRVVVLDSIESSDSKVWLMLFSDVLCNSPLLTENVVLELNKITGTSRVFERMAFLHWFEFVFNGIKLVVIEDRPAVSLVASFISELVIPQLLLKTMLSIVVYHCSVSGSLKDRILFLLNRKLTLCFNMSAL